MKAKREFGFFVLIVGLALCGKGLWMLFSPPMYEAVARIVIEPDNVSDVPNHNYITPYDPYFIETELKVIQGDMVLSNVVQSLHLDATWGKRDERQYGVSQAIEILRKNLVLDPDRNTKIIEIGIWDRDPNEAAQIANAIVQAYNDYRIDQHRQQMEAGIEKLEEEYQAEETNIVLMQSNVDQSRQDLGIHDTGTSQFSPINAEQLQNLDVNGLRPNYIRLANQSSDLQPDQEAKRILQDKLSLHQLLAYKIEADKADALIPKNALVSVIGPAVPPAAPNRWLGGLWLICGLALAGLGFYSLQGGLKKMEG